MAIASEVPTALADTQLTEFEAKSIDLFANAAGVLGLPKSIAMIYGVLFGSSNPLSFSLIEQKLGISKGSVSQGMRVLREMGAIRAVEATPKGQGESAESEPSAGVGTLYEPVIELRILLSHLITDKVQPHLRSSDQTVEELANLLGEKDKTTDQVILKQRLKHLRSWQKRTRDLLPILRTFLR